LTEDEKKRESKKEFTPSIKPEENIDEKMKKFTIKKTRER